MSLLTRSHTTPHSLFLTLLSRIRFWESQTAIADIEIEMWLCPIFITTAKWPASQSKVAIQFENGFISMLIWLNFWLGGRVRIRSYETGEMRRASVHIAPETNGKETSLEVAQWCAVACSEQRVSWQSTCYRLHLWMSRWLTSKIFDHQIWCNQLLIQNIVLATANVKFFRTRRHKVGCLAGLTPVIKKVCLLPIELPEGRTRRFLKASKLLPISLRHQLISPHNRSPH